MVDFEPRAVKFALEFLQRAFEDIFTVKVLREWEALAEARTGETRLR